MKTENAWFIEMDRLFLTYKAYHDDSSRAKLEILGDEKYSFAYVTKLRPSWPMTWLDELERAGKKHFDAALANPSIVDKSLTGYMRQWYRSACDAISKRMRRFDPIEDNPTISDRPSAEKLPSERCEDNEKKELAEKILNYAKYNMKGLQGRIVTLYLLGQMGMIAPLKQRQFAQQFRIPMATVASYIARGKRRLATYFAREARERGI